MDFALSAALTAASPRRRGRPVVAEDPGARRQHIRCAALLLGGQFPAKRVAALFGISRRTAYYWRDLALTYDEPEAVALRRLAGRRASGDTAA